MLKLGKKSAWRYGDSTNVGLTVEIIVAIGQGGGWFNLRHPNGSSVKFYFGSLGVGFGVGAKLNLPPVDMSVPSNRFFDFDMGTIYRTRNFGDKELEISDISGGSLIFEISGGTEKGVLSGTAMLLGIPLHKMHDELYSDIGQLIIAAAGGPMALDFIHKKGWFASSAKAVLFMASHNAGISLGAGVLGSLGYVSKGVVLNKADFGLEPYVFDGTRPDPPRGKGTITDPLTKLMAPRYPRNHPGSLERVRRLVELFHKTNHPKRFLGRIEARSDKAAREFHTILHPNTVRGLLKILRDRPQGRLKDVWP